MPGMWSTKPSVTTAPNSSVVTFWNVTDKHTWLDTYPVPGRKNYPLLFDVNGQPKKAYWKVARFE